MKFEWGDAFCAAGKTLCGLPQQITGGTTENQETSGLVPAVRNVRVV